MLLEITFVLFFHVELNITILGNIKSEIKSEYYKLGLELFKKFFFITYVLHNLFPY